MPFTTSSDGTRLYYEVAGEGPRVLLIGGLGSNTFSWWRTAPELARDHKVVTFDNRGAGRSDVPEGPYRIQDMADDAAAVLEAAGVEQAHVVGGSLGGMIAQRLALRHPRRVASLVLLCTRPGGERSVPAAPEVWAALIERWSDPAEGHRRSAWFLYGRETRERHPERIEDEIRHRTKIPTTAKGYFAQLAASTGHDAYDELASIRAPVLVIHGEEDLLIPPENGRLIADRIPGSELMLIPGAGHMLQSDAGDEVLAAVRGFWGRVRSRGLDPAVR